MEDVIHSDNSIVKSTFLENVLDEYNLELAEIRLCRLCGFDLLGCSWASNNGANSVAGFKSGDKSAESEVAVSTGDLKYCQRTRNVWGRDDYLLALFLKPFYED